MSQDGDDDSDAVVISRRDADIGFRQTGSISHRRGDFLRRTEGEAGDGRAGAAQKTAERAGFFRRGDDPIEIRNELCSKRLVKMIGQSSAQIVIIAAGKGGSDEAGVAAGFDRAQAIDLVRQNPPCLGRFDFKRRDQKNETQARINWKFLVPVVSRGDETAELGRGRVVRMTFELGAKAEDLSAFERVINQGIEGVKHTEPDRHAAAETTGARYFPCHHAGKRERLAPRHTKKLSGGLLRHRARFDLPGTRDGDVIIDLQSDAKTIKPRAEIRSGGGNPHRDLLLFQRESPESSGAGRMAALTLTRAVPAARSGRGKG